MSVQDVCLYWKELLKELLEKLVQDRMSHASEEEIILKQCLKRTEDALETPDIEDSDQYYRGEDMDRYMLHSLEFVFLISQSNNSEEKCDELYFDGPSNLYVQSDVSVFQSDVSVFQSCTRKTRS